MKCNNIDNNSNIDVNNNAHSSYKNINIIKSFVKKKLKENKQSLDDTINLTKKRKPRDHYSCILFIKLGYIDIFKKQDLFFKVYGIDFNELFLCYSLDLLLKNYREHYKKSNIHNPNIYSTFNLKKSTLSFPSNLFSNYSILSEVDNNIGLHISLSRNHLLNKKLSYLFLKNIINKLSINKIIYEYPEDIFKSQNIEINICMKAFGIYLDYSSVIILENSNLYTNKDQINGGLFVCLKINENSKKLYIDPIINIIDDICLNIGIEQHYFERLIHVSLFYIKKDDLLLEKKEKILTEISFKEYLENKSIKCENLLENIFGNMIWIDKLFFRIGIYEFKLLLN